MPDPAGAGQLMAVAGLALILLCLVVALVRTLLVLRRLGSLRRTLAASQADILARAAELAALREENVRLTRPLRRVVRWVRHPLVIAIATSLSDRRRRPRLTLEGPRS